MKASTIDFLINLIIVRVSPSLCNNIIIIPIKVSHV